MQTHFGTERALQRAHGPRAPLKEMVGQSSSFNASFGILI
jgi:hypothetical protein